MSVARRGVAIALAGVIAILGADLVAAQNNKKKQEEAVKTPGPDLIIVDSETVIKAGGCEVDDPLITGTIAIKNQGDQRADRLLAKPISAVYIPETLDIKDEDIVPNALQPLELFSTDILAGKGATKTGRGFEGQRKVFVVVDPYNEIAERNEKNNIIVRTVTFKCK